MLPHVPWDAMSLFSLSPARAVPGGALYSPPPTSFFSNFGGEMASPPLQLHCVTGSHSSHQGTPSCGEGAQPPHHIHLQLHRRLPLLGERDPHTSINVPLPALPQSPSWEGVGDTAAPSVAWGYPDPRGVGLVPGCPPVLRVWGLSGRDFLEGAELSQAFFNVTIWTMPHIFLEGKATVSQKIMGAFLPLCQRRERGSIWGVGVKGFSFPVLFSRLLPALPRSRCWG